jgi:hypothetical protein
VWCFVLFIPRRYLEIKKHRQSLKLQPSKDASYFVHDAKCLLCDTKYLSSVDFAHHENSAEHAKHKRAFTKAVSHYEEIMELRDELGKIYAQITQHGMAAMKRKLKKSVADVSIIEEHIISFLTDELNEETLLEKFRNKEFEDIGRVYSELQDFCKNTLGL